MKIPTSAHVGTTPLPAPRWVQLCCLPMYAVTTSCLWLACPGLLSLTDSFIQQVSIECILCARHQKHSREQTRQQTKYVNTTLCIFKLFPSSRHRCALSVSWSPARRVSSASTMVTSFSFALMGTSRGSAWGQRLSRVMCKWLGTWMEARDCILK